MQRRHLLLTVLFAAMITLPGLIHLARAVSGGEADLGLENRRLAPLPAIDIRVPTETTDGVAAWMNDRFGLRAPLLSLYGGLREELRIGAADDRVMPGRDGFLFLNQAVVRDDFEGRVTDPPGHIAAQAEAFIALATHAAAEDRAFVALIGPNKEHLYPEKMPPYLTPSPGERRIDRLSEALADEAVRLLYPFEALDAERGGALPLYFKTDTHWTHRGAYLAYLALMEALAEQGVDAPILPEDRITFSPGEDMVGDLTKLMGRDTPVEPRIRALIDGPATSTEETVTLGGDPLLDPVIHRQDLPGAPTLFLTADSFVGGMLPFLKQSFSEIVVVRRDPVKVRMDLIDRYPTDAVVFLSVERMLVHPITLIEGSPEG